MESRLHVIDHLALELQAMEAGRVPMNPLRYMVQARLLREALETLPATHALERPGGAHPQIVHALANRFFEDTGHLPRTDAAAHKARSLLERTLAQCRGSRTD